MPYIPRLARVALSSPVTGQSQPYGGHFSHFLSLQRFQSLFTRSCGCRPRESERERDLRVDLLQPHPPVLCFPFPLPFNSFSCATNRLANQLPSSIPRRQRQKRRTASNDLVSAHMRLSASSSSNTAHWFTKERRKGSVSIHRERGRGDGASERTFAK